MNNSKKIITMFVLLGIVCYFVFHALQGKNGLRSRIALKKKMSGLEVQLSKLTDDRRKLDHYIELMKSQKIDPDMLDEQARELLNLAEPSDIIILKPTVKK